jgi:hypothetical protein
MKHSAALSAMVRLILAAICWSTARLSESGLAKLTNSATCTVTARRKGGEGSLTSTVISGSSRFKTPPPFPFCVVMARNYYSISKTEKVQL